MNDTEAIISGKALYELSVAQATGVLTAFLEVERRAFGSWGVDSVNLDYSRQSVVEALKYIATVEFAGGLPSESECNLWFVRLGYYFGESLCKACRHLKWGIGERDTAFENHPVITNFRNGCEAAVITICKNVLLAVALDGVPLSRIEGAVNHWFDES